MSTETRPYAPPFKEGVLPQAISFRTEDGAPLTLWTPISHHNKGIPLILDKTSSQPWARAVIAATTCNPVFRPVEIAREGGINGKGGTMWEGYFYQSEGMDPQQVVEEVVDLGTKAMRYLKRSYLEDSQEWYAIRRFISEPEHPVDYRIVPELFIATEMLFAQARARRHMIQLKDRGAERYQAEIKKLAELNASSFKPTVVTEEGVLRLIHETPHDLKLSERLHLVYNGVAEQVEQSLTGDKKRARDIMRNIARISWPYARAVITGRAITDTRTR